MQVNNKYTENKTYKQIKPALMAVRDALKGEYFVKLKRQTYLPAPAEVQTPLAANRYEKYISGAEFDGFVKQTQRTMVGKLDLENTNIELDSSVEYLIADCDGDGTKLTGAMEEVARNVLAAKFHIGVADYQGLTDLEAESLSVADLEALEPRATIKFYNRESLIDWDFERINGVMQLTYAVLREIVYVLDKDSGVRNEVTTLLVLCLDNDGFYYQKKLTQHESKGGYTESERNYIQVDGQPLDFIPAYIFSDEELESGRLPEELGMLSALSDIAYAKYRASADYKEAMRFLPPTTYLFLNDAIDLDLFEKANGRQHIEVGAGCVNVIPGENSRVEVVGADTKLAFYEEYFDKQDKKARALGATFQTDDSVEKTAKEAAINSAEQNAVLVGLATSLKDGFNRLIAYCALFEGAASLDDYNQFESVIDVKTDFGMVKGSPEEANAIEQKWLNGTYDDEEYFRQLKAIGWLIADVEEYTARRRDNGNDN